MIILYRLLYSFSLVLALVLGPIFSKKLRQYFIMRFRHKGIPVIPKDKFVILIHAASGEAEYAFPLAQKLKEQIANCFIVCSYYSPSYVDKLQAHPDIDLALPLPLDLPGPLRSFFLRLHPQLILISRTDLWPEFLHQARKKHIPVVLFSRTEGEIKNPIKMGIQRWIYQQLHSISLVSQEDMQNISKIFKESSTHSKPHLLVHGDTRWDQAFNKISTLKHQSFLPHPFFVAGSTWEEDLKPLLKAWKPDFGTLVIAPHELHAERLEKLEQDLTHLNLKSQRYSLYRSDPEASSLISKISSRTDVLIIDQMGVLYQAYLGAYGAFIGGSFKKKVHSVMEALVSQTPVILGPYYKNNREATQYLKVPLQGSLQVVSVCENATEMQQQIEALYQRFKSFNKTPPDYLKDMWTKPICQEAQRAPSSELASYLMSILK